MRILLVEDDEALRGAMAYHLRKDGHEAVEFEDGGKALAAVGEAGGGFELALLDVMLPGMSGLEVLGGIRASGRMMPVILVTAMDGVTDRVRGLDAGADDYLVKPFAMEELLARVRAMTRRPAGWVERNRCVWGDLTLDLDTLRVTCGGAAVALTRREAQLLEALMRNPDRVMAREVLFARVWGDDATVENGNLDIYVHFLRKHLGDVGTRVRIRTVRGVGYQLR